MAANQASDSATEEARIKTGDLGSHVGQLAAGLSLIVIATEIHGLKEEEKKWEEKET